MIEKYLLIYKANEEFKGYVDRLMRVGKNSYGKKLNDILGEKIVQNVGDYYLSKGKDSPNSPVSPFSPKDICDCEDRSC